MNAPHSITWPIQSRSHMLLRDRGNRSATAAAVVCWLSLFRISCIHHGPTYAGRARDRFFNSIQRLGICSDSNSIQSNAHPSLLFREKKNIKKSYVHSTPCRRSIHQTAMAVHCAPKMPKSRLVVPLSIQTKNGSFSHFTPLRTARCTYRFILLLDWIWIASRCAHSNSFSVAYLQWALFSSELNRKNSSNHRMMYVCFDNDCT